MVCNVVQRTSVLPVVAELPLEGCVPAESVLSAWDWALIASVMLYKSEQPITLPSPDSLVLWTHCAWSLNICELRSWQHLRDRMLLLGEAK